MATATDGQITSCPFGWQQCAGPATPAAPSEWQPRLRPCLPQPPACRCPEQWHLPAGSLRHKRHAAAHAPLPAALRFPMLQRNELSIVYGFCILHDLRVEHCGGGSCSFIRKQQLCDLWIQPIWQLARRKERIAFDVLCYLSLLSLASPAAVTSCLGWQRLLTPILNDAYVRVQKLDEHGTIART